MDLISDFGLIPHILEVRNRGHWPRFSPMALLLLPWCRSPSADLLCVLHVLARLPRRGAVPSSPRRYLYTRRLPGAGTRTRVHRGVRSTRPLCLYLYRPAVLFMMYKQLRSSPHQHCTSPPRKKKRSQPAGSMRAPSSSVIVSRPRTRLFSLTRGSVCVCPGPVGAGVPVQV